MTDVTEPGNQPVSTREQASADTDDLRAGLADLAGLVADTFGIEELLSRVATYAVHAIPGADGAGLTLLWADRPDNRVKALAASAPFAHEIDEIQYVEVNEGPCITAALERRTVRSGSLGGEKLWPRFDPSSSVNCSPPRPLSRYTTPGCWPRPVAWPPSCRRRCPADRSSSRPSASCAPVPEEPPTRRSPGYAGSARPNYTKLAMVSRHIVDEAVRRARARHTGH